MTAPTLLSMRERAQRQLDGMTINRDALARDVIALIDAVEAAQARAKARPDRGTDGGFASAFDDIFGDIFGTSKP